MTFIKEYDDVDNIIDDFENKGLHFPSITKTYISKKNPDILNVCFEDGTWLNLKRNENDKDDPVAAILYAIAKRIYGKVLPSGYVEGNGFMNVLNEIVGSIVTPQKLEEEKQKRILKKQEEDRKAHEEAVKRRQGNPSIGLRLHNLEDKFEKLIELFSCPNNNNGNNKKTDGGCHCHDNKDKDSKTNKTSK